MVRTGLRALACVAALLAALAAAAPASAGTYTVYSCGGPAGGYNGLFREQADAGMAAYQTNCPVDPYAGSDNMGLVARAAKQAGSVGWLQGAYLIMDAPAGAQIGAVHADVNMDRPYSDSPYWSLAVVGFGTDTDRGIDTNAGMSWGCAPPASFSQCFYAGHIDVGVNKPSVRFEARCGAPNFGSCATHVHAVADAYVSAWNISVDVNDNTLPSIGNVGGGLSTGNWIHGTQRISFDASDNVGVRSASLAIDGADQTSWTNSCDYNQVVPCGNVGGGHFDLNADALSDGSHSLTLYVTDTAGNTNTWSRTIYTDHTAPAAPSVSRAANWQNSNSFSATVANAGSQAAPVSTIYYAICDSQGQNCGAAATAAATQGGNGGQTALSGLTVPADGNYTVRAYEQDAAGNVSASNLSDSSTAHLLLDRTAPAAPSGLASDGGEDWRSTNSFRLSWTNPSGQLAPIAKAYVVECDSGNNCTTTSQSASGIAQATGLTVPRVGDFTSKVYLEDAAGNTAVTSTSGPVHLKFDDTVPGGPQFPASNGWINAAQAKGLVVPLGYQPSTYLPSGVKGYSYTTDGSDPDATIDATVQAGTPAPYAANATLTNVAEGDVVVKARAISGAGVAGQTFGAFALRVDKTAPTVTATAVPDASNWERAPVAFPITATDGLSGMRPVNGGSITDGAYITWRVDDGPPHNVAGDTAQASVGDDGVHTVYYRAYDLAGNPSDEQAVKVRIDVSPPIGSFEAIDASDPRKFVADVADATSGVRDGAIELRPAGGEWRSLDTSYDNNGHLVARVADDAQMPDGLYEARALVTDVAGNQAIVSTRSDGSQMQVAFPLRRPVTLVVSTQVTTQTTCRNVTVRSLRHGRLVRRKLKVCRRMKVPAARRGKKVVLKPSVTKKQFLFAQLRDSAGNPIKNAALTVADQPRTGGGFNDRVHLGTDQNGAVVYAIPTGGPSRTIRTLFEGTDQMKPASGDISVLAPATTTLRVSPTVTRRGKKAIFSGQLAGGYVPASGKLVDLEVFFRRKWRTFATPRSNAKGAWRYGYRFTARYLRTLKYRFRVVVPREQSYPFELGASGTVNVTVRP